MLIKDISKQEDSVINLIKSKEQNSNVIIKIYSADGYRFIYRNDNGNIRFSGSTSDGPVDVDTLYESHIDILGYNASNYELLETDLALYLIYNLN